MFRRCELSCRWIFCVLAVSSSICRLEGLSMPIAPVSSPYSSQGKDIESHSVQIGNSERELAPSSVTFLKGHKRSTASIPNGKHRPNSLVASGLPKFSNPSPSNKPPIVPKVAPTTAFATPNNKLHGSASSPKSITRHGHSGKSFGMLVASPPIDTQRDISPTYNSPSKAPTVIPAPDVFPKHKQNHASLPSYQAPSLAPILPPAPSPSPSPLINSGSNQGLGHSPKISPSGSTWTSKAVPPMPIWLLPPPPPNLVCSMLACAEPYTNPPPGSPCMCVLPIRVGLCLSVTLYTFFPLVSEFAQEISYGIYMKQSQVRIMGANVASEQPENTIVLIDLVPSEQKFDNITALLTFEKFWNKDIVINKSLFGNYAVLYVIYPGLPPSPPRAPVGINISGEFDNNNNGRTMKPLGVDVRKQKQKTSRNWTPVIVLSSFTALILCVGAIWLLLKHQGHSHLPEIDLHKTLSLFGKSPGTRHIILGSKLFSESASICSSVTTYNGSAKTFTLAEIERATNRFDEARVIGEGGFGRVYHGALEDGIQVAVKVLKRNDQQGGREFLAEVEMLSRLHHRNLVKLIGICIEDYTRCLVYELIPNGSVESHLHGVDKQTAPLDWNARMKIALGAARGLAYLHEDSSPGVIHRDFKSSNILLENDYTPKVSDFGLARTALDEGKLHISTQVMGTFGYVAPEYAMTGHLLVKSDVYSYGVVLLELLTGRKPVDMLRPSGQENLVTWARPLLTNMDNLKMIIDPVLATSVLIDSVAKVAAIASMCVQPEVSHRPFMGEVVQALKLVYNECNQINFTTRSCNQDEFSTQDAGAGVSNLSCLESERVLLEFDGLDKSIFDKDEASSFQWHSASGPLAMTKSKEFWQRLRSFSTGSVSEPRAPNRFGTSSTYCK
ncbi:receptor-like serine/threonine-protein kinase ALE2 isoform X2 [Zingiber officinale]|uniref:receptor-like serine/threonine-protein kinase ALE2 isoform X2 n=1 Tax=Zingiber officinale TaxID=94328 RepID=UPI001C4C1285|nr:receptor-like serine/threonine-protein kinase ALE2 isoform X2 [Zingiber officinale]